MNNLLSRVYGVALVAVLATPVVGAAQPITDSVVKLSNADLQRMLATSDVSPEQTAAPRRKSLRKRVLIGAVIGAIPGLALYPYCVNVSSSPCWALPIYFGGFGATAGLLAAGK